MKATQTTVFFSDTLSQNHQDKPLLVTSSSENTYEDKDCFRPPNSKETNTGRKNIEFGDITLDDASYQQTYLIYYNFCFFIF